MARILVRPLLILVIIFALIVFGIGAVQWHSLPAGAGMPVFEVGHQYLSKEDASLDLVMRIVALHPSNPLVGREFATLLDPEQAIQYFSFENIQCAADGQSLLLQEAFLYQFDVRTKVLKQLSSDTQAWYTMAWSPDQQHIAYIDMDDSEQDGILIANTDGSHQQLLYSQPGVLIIASLAWSPDSRSIAFVTVLDTSDTPDAPPAPYQLSILDTATRRVRVVYQSPEVIEQIAWSPDGSRFAYRMYSNSSEPIFTVGVDGSNNTQLTPDGQLNYDPQWSPDGSLISYVSYHGFDSPDRSATLYVIKADGSDAYPVYYAQDGKDIINRCWLKA